MKEQCWSHLCELPAKHKVKSRLQKWLDYPLCRQHYADHVARQMLVSTLNGSLHNGR
jgi:hypothetical protein